MKKNKLSLDSFKVQSFVTSMNSRAEQAIRGGDNCDTQIDCSQGPHLCENDTSPCICDRISNVVDPHTHCFETGGPSVCIEECHNTHVFPC